MKYRRKVRCSLAEIQTNNPTIDQPVAISRFWTGKQVATNVVILALASLAAYLQYYLYPLVMARPLGSFGFGETNISLKFSFLTFQYIATRCVGGTCKPLTGVPAFDFFQAMIALLIFVNVLQYFNTRKKQDSQIS